MSAIPFDQIVVSSLALTPAERSELASALLSSLDDDLPESHKRTPDEWRQEIMRRSKDVNAGRGELLAADESIAQAKSRLAELRQR